MYHAGVYQRSYFMITRQVDKANKHGIMCKYIYTNQRCVTLKRTSKLFANNLTLRKSFPIRLLFEILMKIKCKNQVMFINTKERMG